MERKFKCKDEVIVRYKKPGCCWFYGVVSHSGDDYIVLSGGFRYPYEIYDILPYEGNESLVGTTDSPASEDVSLKKGELLYCFDFIENLEKRSINLGEFEYIIDTRGLDYNPDGLIYVSGCNWVYCIPFSKFNPDDLEATKKEILTVKNGKLVKANVE